VCDSPDLEAVAYRPYPADDRRSEEQLEDAEEEACDVVDARGWCRRRAGRCSDRDRSLPVILLIAEIGQHHIGMMMKTVID